MTFMIRERARESDRTEWVFALKSWASVCWIMWIMQIDFQCEWTHQTKREIVLPIPRKCARKAFSNELFTFMRAAPPSPFGRFFFFSYSNFKFQWIWMRNHCGGVEMRIPALHDSSAHRSVNNFDDDDRHEFSWKSSVQSEEISPLLPLPLHCFSHLNGKQFREPNLNFPFGSQVCHIDDHRQTRWKCAEITRVRINWAVARMRACVFDSAKCKMARIRLMRCD